MHGRQSGNERRREGKQVRENGSPALAARRSSGRRSDQGSHRQCSRRRSRRRAQSNFALAGAVPAANAAAAPVAVAAPVAEKEPLRCIFGATRVGALLGRLRLHLQTERFLAAHRGDALWEAGCTGAAAALTDIATTLVEHERNAALLQNAPSGERAAR